MKEMLLWSRERLRREGRVPNARSDRNLRRFLSTLMDEASQGNSLGSSASAERSHSTLQLLSWVQVQEGGHARTHAHSASAACGSSRHSTETKGEEFPWHRSKKKARKIINRRAFWHVNPTLNPWCSVCPIRSMVPTVLNFPLQFYLRPGISLTWFEPFSVTLSFSDSTPAVDNQTQVE